MYNNLVFNKISRYALFKFFFFFGHLDQGLNLCPQQWKLRVLTIGPPGKSLCFSFKNVNIPQTGDVLEEGGEWRIMESARAIVFFYL